MTILPHPTDQNQSPLDTTNPVVVSADFVLEVSHAHSTANIDFVGVEISTFSPSTISSRSTRMVYQQQRDMCVLVLFLASIDN